MKKIWIINILIPNIVVSKPKLLWTFLLQENYFTLIKQIPLGKNLYVHIEPEDIIIYESICANLKENGNGTRGPILPAYKILPLAAIHFIDKENYLSLFKLNDKLADDESLIQKNKIPSLSN